MSRKMSVEALQLTDSRPRIKPPSKTLDDFEPSRIVRPCRKSRGSLVNSTGSKSKGSLYFS